MIYDQFKMFRYMMLRYMISSKCLRYEISRELKIYNAPISTTRSEFQLKNECWTIWYNLISSDSIGFDWTFFILYYPHRLSKKLKILQLFICGSQVQTATENWYRKSMRGFNFVPIRSDSMLIFLWVGIGLGTFFRLKPCSNDLTHV